MQKTYTLQFTADELAIIQPLVAQEQDFYEQSDDDIDRAMYMDCKNIVEKIYAAS
jgi:hypothetical protein